MGIPFDELMKMHGSAPSAPTEAGTVVPSSSDAPASVSGPDDDETTLLQPGVQSAGDYVPTTTSFKAQEGFFGYGAGETAQFAGKEVRDIYSARRKLSRPLHKQKQREFIAKWDRAPDPDEDAKLAEEARVEAGERINEEFMARRQQGGNEVWMDIDPEGRIAALTQEGEDSLLWRAINPIRASLEGVDIAYMQENQDAPERLTYNEGDWWGSFDWLTRISPGTHLAALAKAAGEGDETISPGAGGFNWLANLPAMVGAWGSEEHIRHIKEGRELVSEANDINMGEIIGGGDGGVLDALLTPFSEAVFGVEGDVMADYGTALALSFFDPDVFSALGPVGYAGGRVARIPKLAENIAKVAKHVPGTQAAKAAKMHQLSTATTKGREAFESALTAGKPHDQAMDLAMKAIDEEAGFSGKALSLAIRSKVGAAIEKGIPMNREAWSALEAIPEYKARVARHIGDAQDVARAVGAEASGGVLGAATRGADKTKRVAGALSKQPLGDDELRLAADLTTAQLEHMAAAAVARDAAAEVRILDRLSRMEGTQKVRRLRDAPQDIQDQAKSMDTLLEAKMEEMQRALLEHAEAVNKADPSAVKAARKTYTDAAASFRDLAVRKMDLIGEASGSAVRKRAEVAQQFADIMAAKVAETYAKTRKKKNFKRTAAKSMEIHEKELARLLKNGEKREKDLVNAVFHHAIRDIEDSFKTLQTGGDFNQGAQAANIMRTVEAGTHIFGDFAPKPISWAADKTFHMIRYLIDPAKELFQMDDPEALQVGADVLGYGRNAVREVTDVVDSVSDPMQKIDRTRQWIDSTDALPTKEGVTSINTMPGTAGIDGVKKSPWQVADPILRHLAKESIGKDAEATPKVIMALARMFVGDAAARMDPRGPRTVLRALEAADGDVDQLMGIIRASTSYAEGVPRAKKADNVYETVEEALARHVDAGVDQNVFWKGEAKAWETLAHATAHGMTTQLAADSITQIALRKAAVEKGITMENAVKAMVTMANPAKTGEGYKDAIALFEALGMRADKLKIYADTVEKKNAGVMSVADDLFIPRALMDELETSMGRLVKTFDLFPAKDSHPIKANLTKLAKGYAHLYSASLVTGVLFPKMMHFTNILFGNFGQMWGEEGVRSAVRTTRATLNPTSAKVFMPAAADHLPGPFGAAVRRAREGMADWLNVPMGNILPGLPEIVTNPHLADFFDPARVADSVKVTDEYTMGDLRRIANTRGVRSSFISTTNLREAFLGHLDESKWGAALRAAQVPKQVYADTADALEQRQRIAMFLDLVTVKKLSPEAAATRVKNALYDWNYPLTAFEKDWVAQYLMFWTFQRKALGQGARILMSPFAGDAIQNMGGAAAALAGKEATSFGLTKDMNKTVGAVQEMQRGEQEEDPYHRVYPWWANKAGQKEWMYTERMDPKLAEAVEKATGRKPTHEAYTLPAFTPLEMTGLYFNLLETTLMKGAPGKAGMEFAASSGGRVTGPMLQAALSAMTGEQEEQWYKTGGNEYAIMDRKVIGAMNMMGLLEASNDSKTSGAVRLTPQGQAAYSLLTPLSYEAIQFLEPMAEAYYFDQGWEAAFVRAVRQYSGIYKSYYYDAEKIVEGDVDAVKKKAGAWGREAKRRDAFTFAPPE